HAGDKQDPHGVNSKRWHRSKRSPATPPAFSGEAQLVPVGRVSKPISPPHPQSHATTSPTRRDSAAGAPAGVLARAPRRTGRAGLADRSHPARANRALRDNAPRP